MSETDNQLRDSLRRIASQVHPDPSLALLEVRRRGRPNRGAAPGATAAVAAAVAALILVASLVARHDSHPRPAGPPGPPGSHLFRAVRTLTPQSLKLHGILRVAVSPAGYLVVTDRSQRVAEVSPSGKVIRTWGRAGTRPGEFRLQSGSVAVDGEGKIYVSDSGNSRVQVFSPSGRYLRSLGGYGTGPGHFIKPADIAVDRSGDLYVADDEAATLTKLSPTGHQIWRRDEANAPTGDLYGHFHFVGIDPNHDLVAANDDAGRLVWISATGHEVAALGTGSSGYRSGGAARGVGEFPHGACGASVDQLGLIYVVSCQDPTAQRHDIEVLSAQHHPIGHLTRSAFATSPVFLPNGEAVFVTWQGNIVEARLLTPTD